MQETQPTLPLEEQTTEYLVELSDVGLVKHEYGLDVL
jgi:hypothetical protein